MGQAVASTQAAQWVQSCGAEVSPAAGSSWQPAICMVSAAGGTAMEFRAQPGMDVAASACKGRTSSSNISRNRWREARTLSV